MATVDQLALVFEAPSGIADAPGERQLTLASRLRLQLRAIGNRPAEGLAIPVWFTVAVLDAAGRDVTGEALGTRELDRLSGELAEQIAKQVFKVRR